MPGPGRRLAPAVACCAALLVPLMAAGDSFQGGQVRQLRDLSQALAKATGR